MNRETFNLVDLVMQTTIQVIEMHLRHPRAMNKDYAMAVKDCINSLEAYKADWKNKAEKMIEE